MIEQDRQKHHQMMLVHTHPNGADEFYCPTCGRRIIFQWPPNYKKTVLDPGDQYASHSGGKGGLKVEKPQLVNQTKLDARSAANLSLYDDGVQLSAHDNARLAEWEQSLGEMGFENLWSGDS